jgi:hypothetical protein
VILSMALCRKCKTDLPPNAKYCLNCGARVGKSVTQGFSINADDLVKKVKELLHEGNVTRIVVKDNQGRLLLELPITAGLVGTIIAPWLALLGAIAALVTKCTITVERKG